MQISTPFSVDLASCGSTQGVCASIFSSVTRGLLYSVLKESGYYGLLLALRLELVERLERKVFEYKSSLRSALGVTCRITRFEAG